MKLDRSVKLQIELSARVREIYAETVHFARSHAHHLECMRASVWESDEYKHAPQWLHHHLRGVDYTLNHFLYVSSLNHAGNYQPGQRPDAPLTCITIGPDGRQFGPYDDSWLKESSEYKSQLKSQHVWRVRWEQGMYKPW